MDVLLPEEILATSPSRRDGINQEDEMKHRCFGCELVQEANILLRLPQVAAVTGQNILHRFYYRKSLKRFDAFTVAMGCVLLASKIEECPKLLREVLYVFHHMYQMRKVLKYRPLEIGGQRYAIWKNELISTERYILKELGFSLYNISEHPHKYILYFVKALGGDAELSQIAWNYLNDSMRLDLCLRYKASSISCAALYMAARKMKFPLPDENIWLAAFGTDIETVTKISNAILSLYHMPKVQWLEPIAEVEHLAQVVCATYDEPRQIGDR